MINESLLMHININTTSKYIIQHRQHENTAREGVNGLRKLECT